MYNIEVYILYALSLYYLLCYGRATDSQLSHLCPTYCCVYRMERECLSRNSPRLDI